MASALIGTGFIGQTLMRQGRFGRVFNRNNYRMIFGNHFDLVVCAAMPGSKREANLNPAADDEALEHLKVVLALARVAMTPFAKFVLISTVDVFPYPFRVDEMRTPICVDTNTYGANRIRLEEFVRDTFPDALIVRLPACVGPGLKKNVVYDLHNGVYLDQIDPRSTYQFYPTVNLWPDILEALKRDLRLIHLVAEPISVDEIARDGFMRTLPPCALVDKEPEKYMVWSNHAVGWGGFDGFYQYSKRDSIQAIRHYAQTEPRTA